MILVVFVLWFQYLYSVAGKKSNIRFLYHNTQIIIHVIIIYKKFSPNKYNEHFAQVSHGRIRQELKPKADVRY